MRHRFRVFRTAQRFSLRAACVALALLSAALSATACAQTKARDAATPATRLYDVEFRIAIEAGNATAQVEIAIEQGGRLARELRLTLDDNRFASFSADGDLEVMPDSVTWAVPDGGGSLRYQVAIPDTRSSGAYDAFVADDWALFRAFDVIPPIATRTVKGARSRSRLLFDLDGDASVTTAYPPSREGGFVVDNPERQFSRPHGWILVGEFGERIDTVGAVRVVVAGPKKHKVRRLDMLAFLHWNLPAVVRLFPDYPSRLFVVSANDPMWRGGLSGPGSLFIHADRPLISENGTSTLLHEVIHTAMRLTSETDDWIVEGFAEYYSVELMRRSGTLSPKRAERAFRSLEKWGREADSLTSGGSVGARTARAVTVFVELDRQIREATHGTRSLDDVARRLVAGERSVNLGVLRAAVEAEAGRPLPALDDLP
ncbi:MAG: hypothetical protein AAFN78_09310 [Pseudomonadota bacterium]